MAETTGSATDLEDFFAALLTYIGGLSGWTVDETISTVDSGRQCAVSKGNLYVQWRWATSSPNHVAMYQSTGFTASTRAGLQTGDSGNGYNTSNSTTDANLDNERCILGMGNSAYPSYYFYTDTTASYVHVVVEVQTDEFRHFGFGNLDKFGDWNTGSGGEYVYAQVGTNLSSGTGSTSNILLDGAQYSTSQTRHGGTMLLSGLPGQTTEVWGHVWGNDVTSELQDSAGNDRLKVIGGSRMGPLPNGFGWLPPATSTSLSPTQPVACWYFDTSVTPREVYLLGFQPDVRMVHLKNLAPKDTFVLGAETWRVFPMVRRAEGTSAGDTDFVGVAYLTNP